MLTVKKARFILALFSHGSASAAARAVGVSERTARRWMKDEEVAHEIDGLRASIMSELSVSLLGDALTARAVLRDLAEDEAQAGSVRVRASTVLLRTAVDFNGRRLDLPSELRRIWTLPDDDLKELVLRYELYDAGAIASGDDRDEETGSQP